jgi:hypothetical protein
MFSVKEERVIKNPQRIEEVRMTYRKKVLLVPGSSFLWSRLMRLRTKFWFLEGPYRFLIDLSRENK